MLVIGDKSQAQINDPVLNVSNSISANVPTEIQPVEMLKTNFANNESEYFLRTELILEIDATEENLYRVSSLGPFFQGVLMDAINLEYADFLHRQEINPYSMYLIKNENDQIVWVINTLTSAAHEQIADVIMSDKFTDFKLLAINADVRILQKSTTKVPFSILRSIFYEESPVYRVSCRLMSPTSFKQQGKYKILPDVRLILQSLITKYTHIVEESDFDDEDLLVDLTDHTEIVSHNIMSSYFNFSQVKIPGFVGRITFSTLRSSTLGNYLKMLLKFGEFSGCGIKTSMGMGALKLESPRTQKVDIHG
jgi:CRISPR-associated endoribonuclease Cas6